MIQNFTEVMLKVSLIMFAIDAFIVFVWFVLSAIFNHTIIDDDHVGVIRRWGTRRSKVKKPGNRFYWLYMDHITMMPSEIQIIPLEGLETQVVIFEGGAPIGFKLEVTYRMVDPVLALGVTNYAAVAAQKAMAIAFGSLRGQKLETLTVTENEFGTDILDDVNISFAELGMRATLCQVVDVDIPPLLKEFLVRPAAAHQDAIGDQIRARNELLLAQIYRDAAEASMPGASEEELRERAHHLRDLASVEDSRGGGIIINGAPDRSGELLAALTLLMGQLQQRPMGGSPPPPPDAPEAPVEPTDEPPPDAPDGSADSAEEPVTA